MLTQDLPILQGMSMEIFGNDISRKVLKTARAAFYRESSFRQTEQRWIDKHFTRDGRMFKLNDDIKNRVIFGHLNLMDEAAMALMNNVDVIFCRNVIIYFAAEARAKLLDMFHKKLRPGGYLLLGHSESLINASTKFELMPLQHDIVYRRPL
jgi:chemotaxis protein methyltransferase CheR